MKSRTWMWMTAVYLFAVLAVPLWTTAQDKPSQDNKPKHKKYKLIDMGTFGGAQSYVNEQANGAPSQNSRGDLVGSAEGLVPLNQYSNGFPCFPGPNVNHGFYYHAGVVTDIGALGSPAGNCSNAQALNESGVVVGNSENGILDPLIGVNEIHAFRWSGGQIADLGTLGGNASGAGGINNRGVIVGFAANNTSDPYSFYYSLIWGTSNGTQTRAFRWERGVMQDLGTLGGPDALAAFTNEGGQIAGQSYTNSTPNPTTGIPTVDPFLWQNGKLRDLGTLGGTFGYPEALNSRGQAVGVSNLAGDQVSHPFLWDGKRLVDLGTLGGDNGDALALNDEGDAVGRADLPDGTHNGFLWRKGVMTDLGRLPSTTCSRANQINNQRQIVGNVSDCVTVLTAFLWENGGPMVDLNTLIPANSSLYLANAIDINDRGEIAGMGRPADCEPENEESCWHAYLLIPDGDCGQDNEDRIAESQRNAELVRQSAPAMTERTEAPLSPIERIRNQMLRGYHFPGQRPAPRD